jgi:alpha-glucosidase
MSQGTRCHQVAMYVIYEAPLQMMCESPSTYRREQETVDFIRKIPTIWDETKVLEAKIGDNCIVARRKGTDWYIGGMTDWAERKFEIPLDFLSGSYDATIMEDGVNANHFAEDYQIRNQILSEKDVLKVEMKSGGGFAVILKKK